MGKKLFSLCMALALCLVLLPATALAAETAGEPQAVPSQTQTVGIWNFNDKDTSDSSGNDNKLITEGVISFEDGCMITGDSQVGNARVDLELNGGARLQPFHDLHSPIEDGLGRSGGAFQVGQSLPQ